MGDKVWAPKTESRQAIIAVVEARRLQGLNYEYQLKDTAGESIDVGNWFEEDELEAL